jgi:hypothetical protein
MTEDRKQKSDEESDPLSFDICRLKQALICGPNAAYRLPLIYYLGGKL